MVKRKKTKKKNNRRNNLLKTKKKIVPDPVKRWVFSLIMIFFALLVGLSFFNLAGVGGEYIFRGGEYLMGGSFFLLPVIFLGVALFSLLGITSFRKKWPLLLLVLSLFIISVSGIASSFSPKSGGIIGYVLSYPFLRFFNRIVNFVVFFIILLISLLITLHPFLEKIKIERRKKEKEKGKEKEEKIIKKEIKPEIKKPVLPKEKISFPGKIIKKPLPVPPRKEKQISQKEASYTFPPLDLLGGDTGSPTTGDIKSNMVIIKKTLENFGIPVEMGEVNVGPTVTQYTLKPGEGIKLSRITSLSNNLSLALAAHPIRIEAPIPGKSLVGIEVPNKQRVKVRLRSLIESPDFQEASSPLYFPVGRDVSGNPVYTDLRKMPHLLVAGSTGSGKTIFLNDLIISLLYRNSPSRLKLVLVDPKRVEFSVYNGLPHLLAPVILKPHKVTNALKWLVEEMERRFDILSEAKTRDIISYNNLVNKKGEGEPLPFILLIIDELADLMAAKGKEIEGFVVRIAQMARAVGIHLILATQRPSVEVITGLIKANITSRVAFQVASQIDSRTILDTAGAEKLLGLGDLLFLSSERAKPMRVQAPFISEKEVKKVVEFIKSHSEKKKVEEISLENSLRESLEKEPEEGEIFFEEGEDPLYEKAKEVVIRSGKASASLLQRRLRIGYARAARLLDMLEERGVVGPSQGAKPREVYFREEGFSLSEEETNEENRDDELTE